MIDVKKLPIPKYKVGDLVWIVNHVSVCQVKINTVIIEGEWFDNGYTSRHDFNIKYECSNSFYYYNENEIYTSKRTAQRKLQKQKIKDRQESIESIKQQFNTIKLRCKIYGLTIDDL